MFIWCLTISNEVTSTLDVPALVKRVWSAPVLEESANVWRWRWKAQLQLHCCFLIDSRYKVTYTTENMSIRAIQTYCNNTRANTFLRADGHPHAISLGCTCVVGTSTGTGSYRKYKIQLLQSTGL